MTRGVRPGKEVGVQRRIAASFVVDGLEFLEIRQTPVALAAERQRLGILQRRFPGHRRYLGLLPGQAGVEVGDRAVEVVGEVMDRLAGQNAATHAADVIAIRAACADGFRHSMRADAAAGVDGPDARSVAHLRVRRPPILRGGEREDVGVERGIDRALI